MQRRNLIKRNRSFLKRLNMWLTRERYRTSWTLRDKEYGNMTDSKEIDVNMKQLTPEQKKTVMEWIKYLGKVLMKAVLDKVCGKVAFIAFFVPLTFSGCVQYPEVYVVRQWEGHYMNTNELYRAMQNMNLKKGESVWVLSNRSLLRVIENVQRKNK